MEAKLNALPQFVTSIDGVDIHFIHVRSRHKDALPIIITHGWPGSIIEQLKILALSRIQPHVRIKQHVVDGCRLQPVVDLAAIGISELHAAVVRRSRERFDRPS